MLVNVKCRVAVVHLDASSAVFPPLLIASGDAADSVLATSRNIANVVNVPNAVYPNVLPPSRIVAVRVTTYVPAAPANLS